MVFCWSCDGVPLKEIKKLPSLQFVITDQMSLLSPLDSNDRSIPLMRQFSRLRQKIILPCQSRSVGNRKCRTLFVADCGAPAGESRPCPASTGIWIPQIEQIELQLYLEGKVQREHFFKKQAMQHIFYSQYNNGETFVPDSILVSQKPGKSPGFPCRFKNGVFKGGRENLKSGKNLIWTRSCTKDIYRVRAVLPPVF
jgi:hypothetical protein